MIIHYLALIPFVSYWALHTAGYEVKAKEGREAVAFLSSIAVTLLFIWGLGGILNV